MINVHIINKSDDMFPHGEVVTTLTCGWLLGRYTEPRGAVTYPLNVGEGLRQGFEWSDLVRALSEAGCPCAHECLMDADHELDFLAAAAAR